ncbi:MAG: hypothetical protein IBX62_03105 [Coriobacteriia bacterium]|nr:hypothetical protein [Coriobacteriia bacterium]
MLLSALGTVAGLVVGIPLGNLVLVAIQSVGLEFDFVFPWSGLMAAVAVGLVFAALAALIPARQAAKLDIIRALRYE